MSSMDFGPRERSYYPAQDARERAAAIKRFIEISGPKYQDVEITIQPGMARKFKRRHMSYASWLMFCAAGYGDVVVLKLRTDRKI